ncbi:hypothetical protein OAJ57_04105 [Alphaproteobacteria bacterium]|nr:hypothetical protein [Alphaproteobacteria bacterium]
MAKQSNSIFLLEAGFGLVRDNYVGPRNNIEELEPKGRRLMGAYKRVISGVTH